MSNIKNINLENLQRYDLNIKNYIDNNDIVENNHISFNKGSSEIFSIEKDYKYMIVKMNLYVKCTLYLIDNTSFPPYRTLVTLQSPPMIEPHPLEDVVIDIERYDEFYFDTNEANQSFEYILVKENLADYFAYPEEKDAWNNKVDKVTGKGLSTNDFTNAYKEVLDFRITKQPEDIYGALNGVRDISITAVGIGLTYQWQLSNDNGTTWTDSASTGYNTNTLTVTIGNTQFNGRLYRCKVTDGNGAVLYSDTCMCIIKSSYASNAQVKAGTESINTIVPASQHTSVFYGLAKAAGDATQASSENTVGEYTANAMEKIREMLGIVVIEESDYESLVTPDANTIYLITEDNV